MVQSKAEESDRAREACSRSTGEGETERERENKQQFA